MPQTITPPSEFPKPPIAFGKIIAIGLMQPAARSSIGGLLEVEIQLFALPIVDETIKGRLFRAAHSPSNARSVRQRDRATACPVRSRACSLRRLEAQQPPILIPPLAPGLPLVKRGRGYDVLRTNVDRGASLRAHENIPG